MNEPIERLNGIGQGSRAGRVYELLRQHYPFPVGLTQLESIAYTKVTNRISDIRKVLRPLGWDIKNETTRSGKQTFSNYRLIAVEAPDE